MRKLSTVFLLAVFSILVFSCQKQAAQNVNRQNDIPKDWKLVDLNRFSFLLPKSMEDKKARGIDSEVWRFEDKDMGLQIDSGMYTNDFHDLKDSYEVKEEKVTIDNKNVKFFIWDENKNNSTTFEVNKDGSIKPHETYEKHFAIGVYFKNDWLSNDATNFVITTKTLEGLETAKKILHSIKFKK